MHVGAVIAAAKMLPWTQQYQQLATGEKLSLWERIVLNFQRAGVKDIVMVTGYQAEEIEKRLRHCGITFLRNDTQTEMLDSAKMGLEYLKDRCERVFFCTISVPFFTEETVQKLLEQDGRIVIPLWQGQGGHPVLLEASLIPAILSYQGTGGLREALRASGVKRNYVVVEDEGAVTRVDHLQDFRRLEEKHNSGLMRPQVKVRLAGKVPFFGPGTVTLLRQIEALGSVREACEKTGISYSKAWKILRTAETELGYRIVERQPGGKHGGQALVTEQGKQLLETFEQFEREVELETERIYNKFFLQSELF